VFWVAGYAQHFDETSVDWYPAPTENPLEKLSVQTFLSWTHAFVMLKDVKAYSPNLKAFSLEIRSNLSDRGASSNHNLVSLID
jgi:hypothetical protein